MDLVMGMFDLTLGLVAVSLSILFGVKARRRRRRQETR